MLKNVIVSIIFTCVFSNAFSEWGANYKYDTGTWSNFKSDTLKVVLANNGESDYDKKLKKAIEEQWYFCKYEFIDFEQMEKLQKSPDNFFLLTVDISYTRNYWSKFDLYNNTTLKIVRGSTWNDNLASNVALAEIRAGNSEEDFSDRLVMYLKNLQWFANLITEEKIKKTFDYEKLIKNNSAKIKLKPLYVLDTDLNSKIKSEADIRKTYDGEVHVITKRQMDSILVEGKDLNVFISVKSATHSWTSIYNVKSGELFYSSSNLISGPWPAGIIKYHIKQWK